MNDNRKQFSKAWLTNLLPGDRFYFVSDGKKTPWEVKEHKTKKVGFSSGHPHILKTIIWQPEISTHDSACRHVQDHEVIFLRSTKTQPA